MRAEHRMVRCAVYTRKSSEEGLEQSFNSLDAQREACIAYIASQKHEGWCLVNIEYDDGGYSGGTLDRPALKQLLLDIDAGKIDTVVVYKVDRLTRSLTDFARIVESFDAKGVSFVSVTQQFNTTTSMGRLTLNVLLSFAQFEREVTGERIRDKVAASKRKGMWMGGNVPLGYDLKDRKLIVNPEEAALVTRIFRRYLEVGCVAKLKADLDQQRLGSKVRISRRGRTSGGKPYSRGALYHLLQNRLYLGEVIHRHQSYPGEHEAIISPELWTQVDFLLRTNNHNRRKGVNAIEPSLLAGLLFDDRDNRLTPSHAVKNGKRYRYYVSQAVIQRRPDGTSGARRIPAHDIENLVVSRLKSFLNSGNEVLDALELPPKESLNQEALIVTAKAWSARLTATAQPDLREFLLSVVSKATVCEESVDILIDRSNLYSVLMGIAPSIPRASKRSAMRKGELVQLSVDAHLRRHGREMKLILPASSPHQRPVQFNAPLIKAIAHGYRWYESLTSGKVDSLQSLALEAGVNRRYISRIIRCVLLAPDIVDLILEGRQPPSLTLDKLSNRLPMEWTEQRRFLGITG